MCPLALESLFGIVNYVNVQDLINFLSTGKEAWALRKEFLKRWAAAHPAAYDFHFPEYMKKHFYNTKMIFGPEFKKYETHGPMILERMGPTLVLSDLSTADKPVLVYNFTIYSNVGVIFGAIAIDNKSMYGSYPHVVAFSSREASGSNNVRLANNANITIVLKKGAIKIFIKNQIGGIEPFINSENRIITENYNGSPEIMIKMKTDPNLHYRIGLNLWYQARIF